MIEEIKTDNNCIVKAFENNPIAILHENTDNKKMFYFKAADVGKALKLTNISVSIQSYDDDERVIRKAYDTTKRLQDTVYLSSQGVYRLLYSSKKEIAKKFRKWAGNILDDIIFNESAELKLKLQETEQLLLEKDKLLEELENKPETEGFNSREPGDIYCIKDTTKPGHLKIGIANKSITRVDQLNVGSSTHSLELYTKFETFDRVLAEKLIHHSLNPFRIKNRKEWFYFKNDLELAYAISVINKSLEYIKDFNIENYAHFKDLTVNLDITKELIKPEIIKELQTEQKEEIKQHIDNIKKNIKTNAEKAQNRTDTFKGTTFAKDKQQWKSEIQHNNKRFFLGYFTDEVDAAKVYNDYAAYLNQTENTEYLLNDIPGYKTVPRNVPEQNAFKIETKKSSKYNGVSYDSKRKCYLAAIKLSGKTYNLGSSQNEIDCAKMYNQQALFFNNKFNTHYTLNDIEKYITLPNDLTVKETNKTSKYHGVSITSTNKWACSYMMNRKKIHIGTFKTELEACEAYNKIVIELNKNGCNYKVNLNEKSC